MSPTIIGALVGAVALAGTAAWGFSERAGRIEERANAATYRLASEKNLKAFQDMQRQAAANAELSRANAEQLRMIEDWRIARDTDIAKAIEAVCPDAPMDALLRRLCEQRGGTDC